MNRSSEPTPISQRKIDNKFIYYISADTNKGSVRETNEDRISIILNIDHGNKNHYNFFGIYDGHGGSRCSEYLKDNLH